MNTDQIPVPKAIGSYHVYHRIAFGGMGEIYLVQDPSSPRKLALKKIREDRRQYPTLKERFIKEAKIASQLSHPCIIPIFSTYFDSEQAYYTMPYVEGQTLKEILKQNIIQESNSQRKEPAFSLSSLIRIFLSICQGIAYCHSKGVLHRDIKPENVIIGKFGQTLILDWGLASYTEGLSEEEENLVESEEDLNLTRPGKIPGTLSYIAPERILQGLSSKASDIYALGVVLYQILTLKLPFHRKSPKNIKKIVKSEKLTPAAEQAPYRDIPWELDLIAQKCLASDPTNRYSTVDALIFDLENYIEGKGKWFFCKHLDITDPLDWQFQENILLSKHQALAPSLEMTEWVNLMVSKEALGETLQIEVSLTPKKGCKGIGFLLKIPGPLEKKSFLEEGLCLWIGSEKEPGCTLTRSNAEILFDPDIALKEEQSYKLLVEVKDGHLHLFIDGKLSFAFHSHIPSIGVHIGVMLKDSEMSIQPLKIYSFSTQIYVSCLEIPDRFVVDKQYEKALTEYRKINAAFPGRSEQRLAIFKAGICLIEWAKTIKRKNKKTKLIEDALEEFSLLKNTSGAPLEYLGKSFAYQTSSEIEEEVKCLELSLHKYPSHPLKHLIEQQLLFRLHQSAYQNRIDAHYFFLLTLRHLPHVFSQPHHQNLLQVMQKQSHPIWFLQEEDSLSMQSNLLWLSLSVAFICQKSSSIIEIIDSCDDAKILDSALFTLIALGREDLAKERLHRLSSAEEQSSLDLLIQWKEKKISTKELIRLLSPLDNLQKQRAACLVLRSGAQNTHRSVLEKLIEVYDDLHPKIKVYVVSECLLIDSKEILTSALEDKGIDPRWRAIFSAYQISGTCSLQKVIEALEEHSTFYLLEKFFLDKRLITKDLNKLPLFPYEKKEISYILKLLSKKTVASAGL